MLLDQAVKLWLLFGYDLAEQGAVALTPFFDLVLVWNKGISYGLFQQESALGRWALLGLKLAAVLLLWVWMARVPTRWSAVSLGLIIGGRHRQCHRPPRLWSGGGLRAFPHHHRRLGL